MVLETFILWFLIVVVVVAIPLFIWAYGADKKRMAELRKFQKSVMVGTDTDAGIVTRIEGNYVVTERYTHINHVWPRQKQSA